ncbi:hypothetical protein DAVIS_01538 [Mycobacterium marinum]|uniref:Uncharacterized protein n=1 Tax=Mycobacterium marinum TaxID=1781 RepID=A0A3E2MZ47_MYCMR|nr:hypothetical protein [Mycobacterium marinum]RFZ44514.1 hypothetical protein DAVIS_01538 [Mycobacterium marinum]GJO37162.1 hypothetical protein NJB1604_01520 [Mycobacterium marinum]
MKTTNILPVIGRLALVIAMSVLSASCPLRRDKWGLKFAGFAGSVDGDILLVEL